jgi:uncharacterized membrane protein
MRFISHIVLKGLATILPVGLTLYLIYWFSVSMETMLRPMLEAIIPDHYYHPGMGLVAGIVALFFIGLLVNAWIVQRLIRLGESILERIPLIKSVYGGLRDFMDFFSSTQQRKDMQQVVMVTIEGMHLLGFVTQQSVANLPDSIESDDLVAVYLPMSYQIGGYTVYIPRSKLTPVDMKMEDAMRQVLTAGLSKTKG